MTQKVCFVVWSPALKYTLDIVNIVKKRYKFISCEMFEFSNDLDWLALVNIVYVKPLDQFTIKRYDKVKGFKGHDKKVAVIKFYATENNAGTALKKTLRNKFKDISYWHIVHSTDSTAETKQLFKNLKKHCIHREKHG